MDIYSRFKSDVVEFIVGCHGDFHDLVASVIKDNVDYRSRHFSLLVDCVKSVESAKNDRKIQFSS